MKPERLNVMYGIMAGVGLSLSAPASIADPADPNASIPATRYESAFDQYQSRHSLPQLNWKTLFTTDAAFNDAVTEIPAAPNTNQMPLHDHRHKHDHMKQDAKIPPADRTQADVKMSSDTRGRIESINKTDGKIKVKHGPIPKFEMPGMTMVFRVQHPNLLDQVKVGDEVGMTMEQICGVFVITGFQK